MYIIKKIIAYIERKEFNKIIKKANISIGENVVFKKFPLIQIHKDSKLIIEDNVTLNSNNHGYHVNMYSKCKLMADRPNARITIGRNTRFHGSCIHAYRRVDIGENCLIAANCQIIDCNGHDLSFPNVENRINTKGTSKDVIIEDSVWLGTGVIVLPGVRIGRGSIVSANSVVHCDIPPYTIAGGNPLKIIKINNYDT